MLNLNEFVKPDEKIIFGEEEFIVTPHVPTNLLIDMQPDENLKEGDIKQNIEYSKNFLKKVLNIKNDEKKVDNFVNRLDMIQLTQVSLFISEFIKNCMEPKKKQD